MATDNEELDMTPDNQHEPQEEVKEEKPYVPEPRAKSAPVSPAFKNAVKGYLDKRAADDELFAVKYANPEKSLDDCLNYIVECAYKAKVKGYADEDVYNMAMHYYEEDDLKKVPYIPCNVIINHAVELTEEEIAKVKEDAMNKAMTEAQKALTKPKRKAVVEDTPSLF